jgi:hypothetical protein
MTLRTGGDANNDFLGSCPGKPYQLGLVDVIGAGPSVHLYSAVSKRAVLFRASKAQRKRPPEATRSTQRPDLSNLESICERPDETLAPSLAGRF